jgi:hypothetical protein
VPPPPTARRRPTSRAPPPSLPPRRPPTTKTGWQHDKKPYQTPHRSRARTLPPREARTRKTGAPLLLLCTQKERQNGEGSAVGARAGRQRRQPPLPPLPQKNAPPLCICSLFRAVIAFSTHATPLVRQQKRRKERYHKLLHNQFLGHLWHLLYRRRAWRCRKTCFPTAPVLTASSATARSP